MQRQMFVTAYELLDRRLWQKFCDLRDMDVFAVHRGKIKENRKFRLNEREMRELGFYKEAQKCPRNLR